MPEDTTKIESVTPLRQSFDDNQTIQVCREAVLELQKENQDITKATSCIEQLGDLYLEEGVSISEILRGVIHKIDDETPRLGEFVKRFETKAGTVFEARRQASIFLEKEESPLSQDKFDVRPVLKSDLGVFFRPERVLLRSQHGVGVKVFLGDRWKFVGHFEGGLTVNGTNQMPDGPENSIVSSPGIIFIFGGGIMFPNDIELTLDISLAQDRNEYFSLYYEEIPDEYTTWNTFFDTTLALNLKGFRLFAGAGTRGFHAGIGFEKNFDIKSAIERAGQKG